LPAITSVVAKLTPAAWTLILTWPAASGVGSISSNTRSSGSPQRRQTIAFMNHAPANAVQSPSIAHRSAKIGCSASSLSLTSTESFSDPPFNRFGFDMPSIRKRRK
jgi:hypothetical protein